MSRRRGIAARAAAPAALMLTAILAAALLFAFAPGVSAQGAERVEVVNDSQGSRLVVGGRDFMVFGMNWDYYPIGENYMFDIWSQPDDFIKEALARDMPLMKSMGVNAIRQGENIPPRWVKYIYENYGIYTIVNHTVGRYGYTLDGVWMPSVDYSNPHFREVVKEEIVRLAEKFEGVPGMLMLLLGNENNYGLSWTSFEIEALPEGERDAARARHLYSLFNDITVAVKEKDPGRVVAIANGDIQYLDLITEECRDIDILGTNVYRGISARDLFEKVKKAMGIPVMFTEFGSDAWNEKEMREDQGMQARYLLGQWEEIYEQSWGKGRVGNAIGGLIFQWTDGWWKFGQDSRLDIHDTNASWPNGGYSDYTEGDNNMNEEWWGITAKGPSDLQGLYHVYPRTAYFVLKKALTLDPYAPTTDIAAIQRHFASIDPGTEILQAQASKAAMISEERHKVHLSGLRMHYVTFNTGGERITTPEAPARSSGYPSFRGFDHMETMYADFEAKPTDAVTGRLSINILGHVAENPINEIFYENRGRVRNIQADGQSYALNGIERVKVYQGSMSWDSRWFLLDGFYRTGHTHWGYDGDMFGLYRDAYYGSNVDIYNGEAPVGMEMTGKRIFDGFKLAFGPQLWWGANPAVMLKYDREIGPFAVTSIYQEDLAKQSAINASFAIPLPRNRKFTLAVKAKRGVTTLELGGIVSGSPQIDRKFDLVDGSGDNAVLLRDKVRTSDIFGGKAKITVEKGRWHWYAQSAYMGIVADGGPTSAITFTGWQLKDTGMSNQVNAMSGLAVDVGKFQIAPNVLWQKPIVGPIPSDIGIPRNIIEDPFAVRANRETFGAELMLTYDPTPATWMWAWDNDRREDSRFAASIGYVFRHYPTTQDAAIGILADGTTAFAFPGAPPPRDLGEVSARIVSRISNNARFVGHLFYGTNEPNGDDDRLVRRYGGDGRLTVASVSVAAMAKFNDWGPYDYHRDFNLTYPIQLAADVSYALGKPRWFDFPQTSIGITGIWRSLDKYSPRYCPGLIYDVDNNLVCDPNAPGADGREWEIRTYMNFSL